MPAKFRGGEVTMVLATRYEVADVGRGGFYDWLCKQTKIPSAVIDVASGREAAADVCPTVVQIIEVHMHDKGNTRSRAIACFYAACEQAADENKLVGLHCNNTFHRGTILAVAAMIASGG